MTQAGAIGDPYGSGIRTVWWVYGVGPVKVVFEHAGGDAPIATSVLVSTNQTPKAPPPDGRYFPLVKGAKLKYSWTNTKHLKKASVQEVTDRRGRERLGPLLGQAPLGPDPRRGRLRLHDADRRRHEHLGDHEVGVARRSSRRSARATCRRTGAGASRRRST